MVYNSFVIILSIVLLLNFNFITTQIVENICEDQPTGTFLPHPASCQHYYYCNGNVMQEGICPGDLYINVNLQICDYPHNVECSDNSDEEDDDEYMCPPNGISFIERNDTCSEYFMCFAGYRINQQCSAGLYFDNNTSKCAPPEFAECFRQLCPTTNDPENIVKFANPANCEEYFICYDGTPMLFSCWPNIYYNTETSRCDFPENVHCGGDI